MGFKEAIRTCLRQKYFTLQGRASRSEYWYYMLFTTLVIIALVALFMVLGGYQSIQTGNFTTLNIVVTVAMALFVIYIYIPAITVQVRRFHDRNLSGWWVLAVAVLSNAPYVGFIISIASLVITILKGTEGENKYGRDPLQAEHSAEVFG